jgi:ABC-2 type transport system ATP-binding protein
MAEHAGIFPGGSGVDAVAFAGMLSGLGRREALRRAHRALDALAVGEERYRPARTFSTGMRQRCKLAMSLVHDPEFLVLDEPTVGLDPPGRMHLLQLIRDLRDEGRRILISTHILPDAEFLCDQMLLLREGTVAFSGPVGDLVTVTAGKMVARGPGLGEGFAAALERAGISVLKAAAGTVVFQADDAGDLTRFWQAAAEGSVQIHALEREGTSLEEAVLSAMETRRE